MKIFVLFTFILFSSSAFGQKKLNGIFGNGSQMYTFSKNGTFEYLSENSFSTHRGRGNYILKKDKLKLTFIHYEPLENSLQIENRNCKSGEYQGPIFVIKDKKTKNGISGAVINFHFKNSYKFIGNLIADTAGIIITKAGIYLEKYKDSLITAYAYRGDYDNFEFDFNFNSCNNYIIQIDKEDPHNQKIPAGSVQEYTLKTFTNNKQGLDGIILLGDTSSIVTSGYKAVLEKGRKPSIDVKLKY